MFGSIEFQRYGLQIVNLASRIFKAIGQLLVGVLHFKDWRTQCHLAAIAVVLALEEYEKAIARTSELGGVHVHIMFMPSGFIGVRSGDGDAKIIISHTVQITFIFIDFRVCDLRLRLKPKTHIAFRVLNAFYYQTDFNLRFKRKRDVRLTCKRV